MLRWDRPIWHPALKRLIWKSGAQAMLYGAAEPESLRGPQFTHAWADELAKWPYAEGTWDNLMLGLRLGNDPRVMATTTPRPVPLIRLVGQGDVVVSRGRTYDNRRHLAAGFLAAMERDYGGTMLGRQELDGELIDEPEGALWTRALISGRACGGICCGMKAKTPLCGWWWRSIRRPPRAETRAASLSPGWGWMVSHM